MPQREQVRRYILNNFLFSDDESKLSDSASLLDEGIIDSTGVLELVAFLESQFGIQVENHELAPENLDSVERIASFIDRKRTDTPATALSA